MSAHVLLTPDELKDLVKSAVIEALASNPQATAPEELMTESQAAQLFKVAVHTLRDARRRGKLECFRVGRFPRYSRAQLEDYLRKA